MTDDEAFIRAVVDAPGDDTPRLVYADWLDDHADPRGPYLRAEWEAVAAGDVARLRERAAGLDPVWVARVSRPPYGVCCDRVRFTDRGPRVTPADIDALERRLGGRFSPGYRAFLLDTNGGAPDPAHVPDPHHGEYGPACLYAHPFLVAGPAGEGPPPDAAAGWGNRITSERAWMEELYEADGGWGPSPLIWSLAPVARTVHDLGYLLIGIGDLNRGRVFHFRDYAHGCGDPTRPTELAPTFADLLARLGPDLED